MKNILLTMINCLIWPISPLYNFIERHILFFKYRYITVKQPPESTMDNMVIVNRRKNGQETKIAYSNLYQYSDERKNYELTVKETKQKFFFEVRPMFFLKCYHSFGTFIHYLYTDSLQKHQKYAEKQQRETKRLLVNNAFSVKTIPSAEIELILSIFGCIIMLIIGISLAIMCANMLRNCI